MTAEYGLGHLPIGELQERAQAIWDEVQAALPGARLSKKDYDCTWTVELNGKGVYLWRTWRPERDGFFDVAIWPAADVIEGLRQ